MTLPILDITSPNRDDRPDDAAIDILMLHYTGMKTGQAAIERLCDREAKVSAHYVVEEDGRLFRLVDESDRAWHAGISHWAGHDSTNNRSIGIEIVNPGHEFGYRAFPAEQMQAVTALAKDILSRHAIPARNVVGHSDVAPTRKEDPGELFDWAGLAAQGIGLWHGVQSASGAVLFRESTKEAASNPDIQAMQQRLKDYGYGINPDGWFGGKTKAVVTAFQRHFHPEVFAQKGLIGQWTKGDAARLDALLAKV